MPVALGRTLSLVVALIALPAVALAVDCGDTIPAGSNVQLQKNVDFTGTQCSGSGVALTIVGPAKVDMGGIRILGDGGPFGDAIVLLGSNVKLSNGGIARFRDGITLGGEGRHSLSNIAATDTSTGFRLTGDRNKLKDTTATRAGTGYFVNSSGNKLIGVVATNNVAFGILTNFDTEKNLITKSFVTGSTVNIAVNGSKHSVSKNVVTGWGHDGILLGTLTTETKIQKNLLSGGDVASGQGEAIHALAGSADNQITKNLSIGNRVRFDLRDDNGNCIDNRWTKNLFRAGTPSSCIE